MMLNEINTLSNDNISPLHWHRERLDWERHVEQKVFENRFHIFYRMNYDTFIKLYNVLSPYIHRDLTKCTSAEPISNILVVACGLRYLAGEKIRSLESDFGISKSSTYVVRELFINAVLSCPDLDICFPSNLMELNATANGFSRKSSEPIFCGCVGAIDGFFAPIEMPNVKDCFGNQKQCYSGHYRMYGLNVQAVVDSNLRFSYFSVSGPASMNDCRSYKRSDLKPLIDSLPDGFYIIGDAAYPLSNKLLIPFVGSQRLDRSKDAYNFYLSQLRIRVEMAFGRMVRKWSILQQKLCCSLEMNAKIIVACGRLHNFVLLNNDNELDNPVNSVNIFPDGFEYSPTRIEDSEDFESFISVSVLDNCRDRNIIVDYIRSQNFERPRYNISRNSGNADLNDSNIFFHTVI